jgi:DNA-binding CsgD family transcriptional regulator
MGYTFRPEGGRRGGCHGEIGTILTMSDDTVDTYMRRIFKKLNANARGMAVSKALSYGLIRP